MMDSTNLDLPRDAPRPWHVRAVIEVPTILLIVLTYTGWLLLTFAYRFWPLWLVAPAVIVVLTLHSSLQHEILHGHPTRWRGLNRLLALAPLSLWLPYERYRQQHLLHHDNERLTDPRDDPESFYWTPEDWARLAPVNRILLRWQQTLAGRILIGPFWRIAAFLRAELGAAARGEEGVRAAWLEHLLWCVPVLLWVMVVCRIPLWIYLLTMVVPSLSLLLIRSFAEHRARPSVPNRTAIVERSWVLGPLFLFNNLHSLHHAEPLIPWYDYNARYRVVRERLLVENGGLVYVTYFDVARRFLFRPHDVLTHPTGRVPRATAA